jgi:hypothetical protein
MQHIVKTCTCQHFFQFSSAWKHMYYISYVQTIPAIEQTVTHLPATHNSNNLQLRTALCCTEPPAETCSRHKGENPIGIHCVQNCVMKTVQVTLSHMCDMTQSTCNVTGWPFMHATCMPPLSPVICAVTVHRGSQACHPHDGCMTSCPLICACHGTRVSHMKGYRTV